MFFSLVPVDDKFNEKKLHIFLSVTFTVGNREVEKFRGDNKK